MSKLYHTEQGHVIPTLCEELTSFRRARKTLHLPPTAAAGRLYVLARPYPGSQYPLHIAINGQEIPPIPPTFTRSYTWFEASLQPGWLKPGENVFEFWTDGSAMNAWSLGIEAGHACPGSAVSDDGGKTWRAEKMGYQNMLLGEYIVRVRLAEGQDPPPPPITWEDLGSPRLQSLRQLMPAAALEQGDLMGRVRALTAWLSTAWAHVSSGPASVYAPWDAETILAWGRMRLGHDQRLPVTMCVHYAVAFVSACMALRIPARCLVGADSINGSGGHFLAEVWFNEYGKWVVVDPNVDVVYYKEDTPLCVDELRAAGHAAGSLAVWGPGGDFQRRLPHIEAFIQSPVVQHAGWATHRCLWPRTDFLSHPECSPPAHGMTAYCETGLVWESKDLGAGLGMFPYFASPDYFNAPPHNWPVGLED